MKAVYLLIVFAILLVGAGQIHAGEKQLSKQQVPKAVLEAFQKTYPNAEGVEYEKEAFEGKEVYELEFKEKDKEYELLYSADGVLLQREEEIESQALPDPVMRGIRKAYPNAEIKEVEKLMTPDEKVTGYEVDIKREGEELELKLDTEGKILQAEPD